MAKNISKKSQFSGMMDGIVPTKKETHEYTPTHEYVSTPTPTPKRRPKKEKTDYRVSLLMKASTVEALDMKAAELDVTRNELIRTLVDRFLEE